MLRMSRLSIKLVTWSNLQSYLIFKVHDTKFIMYFVSIGWLIYYMINYNISIFVFVQFLIFRLQILADRLVDRFTSLGLMQHQYDHVKLHITVMNSLMRKDLTAVDRSRSERERGTGSGKERQSFDASNILKVCTYHLKALYRRCRGTDFPRSRNRGRNRGKAYLKRNSRFSAKTLLITSKKHTLLSKHSFQCHFENRNGQYLTTLICVSVTPN